MPNSFLPRISVLLKQLFPHECALYTFATPASVSRSGDHDDEALPRRLCLFQPCPPPPLRRPRALGHGLPGVRRHHRLLLVRGKVRGSFFLIMGNYIQCAYFCPEFRPPIETTLAENCGSSPVGTIALESRRSEILYTVVFFKNVLK